MNDEDLDEILDGRYGTPTRLAEQLLECVCTVLACSPFGVPKVDPNCDQPHRPDENGECKIVTPFGNDFGSFCCGVVAVGVVGFEFVDPESLRPKGPVSENCWERPWSWAVNLGVMVSRCVPQFEQKAGLPTGDLSPHEQHWHAAEMNADALALMLAQEACFGCSDRNVVDSEGNPLLLPTEQMQIGKNKPGLWQPAAPQQESIGPSCRANIIGFGRAAPIRVHMGNDWLPCMEDCFALGVDAGEG